MWLACEDTSITEARNLCESKPTSNSEAVEVSVDTMKPHHGILQKTVPRKQSRPRLIAPLLR